MIDSTSLTFDESIQFHKDLNGHWKFKLQLIGPNACKKYETIFIIEESHIYNNSIKDLIYDSLIDLVIAHKKDNK